MAAPGDKTESQLASATAFNDVDMLTGLQSTVNKNFSWSLIKSTLATLDTSWIKSDTTYRPNISGNYSIISIANGNIEIKPNGTGAAIFSTPLMANVLAVQDITNDVGASLPGMGIAQQLEVFIFGIRANRLADTTLKGWGDSIIFGNAGGIDPQHSPNLMFYTETDLYPAYDIKVYGHSNIQQIWDAYTIDGTNWLSSDVSSFRSIKDTANLRFQGAVTVGAGAPITWLNALSITANGFANINKAAIFDAQASAPTTDNGTVYYDSVVKKFLFREDGAWNELSDTSVWNKVGTVLTPTISGNYTIESTSNGNIEIKPNGSGAFQLSSPLGRAYGGTGIDTSAATDGQLLIGATTGDFALATLTAGSNIAIANAGNSITVATSLTPTFTTAKIGGVTILNADPGAGNPPAGEIYGYMVGNNFYLKDTSGNKVILI